MWARYLQALKTRPIATNTATALCINFMGDMLAQNIEHSGNSLGPTTTLMLQAINWERTCTVATFGMLTAGPACYWFGWLDRTFPLATANKFSSRGLWTLAQKLTVHLGIFAPTINACFYGWIIMKDRIVLDIKEKEDWQSMSERVQNIVLPMTSTSKAKYLQQPYQEPDEQSAIARTSPTNLKSLSFWQEWYTKLERDLLETQMNSVKLWGPTQTFNFLVLGPHTRVLFSNCVMVVWTTYLSIMGHKKHDAAAEADHDALPPHQEY